MVGSINSDKALPIQFPPRMKKLSGQLLRHSPRNTTCAELVQEVHWLWLGPLTVIKPYQYSFLPG